MGFSFGFRVLRCRINARIAAAALVEFGELYADARSPGGVSVEAAERLAMSADYLMTVLSETPPDPKYIERVFPFPTHTRPGHRTVQ